MNKLEELIDKTTDIHLLMKNSTWFNNEMSEITKISINKNNTIEVFFQDKKSIILTPSLKWCES